MLPNVNDGTMRQVALGLDLKRRLVREAVRRQVPMVQIIREALERHLDRLEKEAPSVKGGARGKGGDHE